MVSKEWKRVERAEGEVDARSPGRREMSRLRSSWIWLDFDGVVVVIVVERRRTVRRRSGLLARCLERLRMMAMPSSPAPRMRMFWDVIVGGGKA